MSVRMGLGRGGRGGHEGQGTLDSQQRKVSTGGGMGRGTLQHSDQ